MAWNIPCTVRSHTGTAEAKYGESRVFGTVVGYPQGKEYVVTSDGCETGWPPVRYRLVSVLLHGERRPRVFDSSRVEHL